MAPHGVEHALLTLGNQSTEAGEELLTGCVKGLIKSHTHKSYSASRDTIKVPNRNTDLSALSDAAQAILVESSIQDYSLLMDGLISQASPMEQKVYNQIKELRGLLNQDRAGMSGKTFTLAEATINAAQINAAKRLINRSIKRARQMQPDSPLLQSLTSWKNLFPFHAKAKPVLIPGNVDNTYKVTSHYVLDKTV